MSTSLATNSYEQQLVKMNQTIKVQSFAQSIVATQLAHQAHKDSENLLLSILGSGSAIHEIITQEFGAIGQELKYLGQGINSLNSGLWSIDSSIRHASQAFMTQLMRSEEYQQQRHAEIQEKVGQVISSLSYMSLQMASQAEIMLDGIRLQEKMFSNIISSIDSLHQTAQNPLQTQARELFTRGLQSYSKQLLPEAHDDFLLAIEKHKTEPMSHFFLGKIYLYGVSDNDNLVDYDKGIEELKLALRYTKPDIGKERQIALLYAEISKHLAKAYYLKAKLEEVLQ